MTGEHLDPDEVAGIAMLEDRDPERVRAEAHAAGCPACEALLASASLQLALLDQLAEPPAPSAEALRRARDAVHARLHRPPAVESIALVSLLALAGFVLPLLVLPHVAAIPWLLTVVALAAVIGRTAMALAKGTPRDAGMALFFALGIAAVMAVLDADGDSGGHGVNCALLELGTALLPAGTALALAHTGRLDPTPLSMAAVAASGALAGQLALHALCADRELTHLIPFHLGAVIVAALIGGLAGKVGTRTPAA